MQEEPFSSSCSCAADIFWHRVSIGSGCFDEQAGERPWIGSAEEDFSQVGQNKGPSHDQKAFLSLFFHL